MLTALSSPETEDVKLAARAITYPTRVSHQSEANPLVARASTSSPQSWLRTLTESVLSSSFWFDIIEHANSSCVIGSKTDTIRAPTVHSHQHGCIIQSGA